MYASAVYQYCPSQGINLGSLEYLQFSNAVATLVFAGESRGKDGALRTILLAKDNGLFEGPLSHIKSASRGRRSSNTDSLDKALWLTGLASSSNIR